MSRSALHFPVQPRQRIAQGGGRAPVAGLPVLNLPDAVLDECRRLAEADGLPAILTIARAAAYLGDEGPHAVETVLRRFQRARFITLKKPAGTRAWTVRSIEVVFFREHGASFVEARARAAASR